MKYLWNLIFKRKLDVYTSAELLLILERISILLEMSEDSAWSDMEVKEVFDLIEKTILALKTTRKVRVSKLYYVFYRRHHFRRFQLKMDGQTNICSFQTNSMVVWAGTANNPFNRTHTRWLAFVPHDYSQQVCAV